MRPHLATSHARAPLPVGLLLCLLLVLSWPDGPAQTAISAGLADAAATPPGLLITEIMYNPSGGQEYEFIELKNTGSSVYPLDGVAFVTGITFAFPPGAGLAPGGFAVLVQDPVAFATRYPGIPFAGVYAGRLDNAGERLVLQGSSGTTLLEMTYDDTPPWPVSADGLGYSLVLADVSGDPNLASTWRASTFPKGSPGSDDPAPITGTVRINEVLAHSDPPYEDAIELLNPSNSPIPIGGWLLSDDATNLRKYRIPDGITVPAQGYAVFYEYQFNPNPGVEPSFALGANGDELHLAATDSAGVLTGYIDSIEFGASDVNVALGRHPTSAGFDLTALRRPTFGVNEPASLQQFRTGAGAANTGPRVGPVVINELHYHPIDGVDEFVELLNVTNDDVPLYDPLSTANTWRMIEGISYTFPIDTVLPARSFMLLAPIEPDLFRARYAIPPTVPILGPFGGSLSNAGERIDLARPGDEDQGVTPYIAVDAILYDDQAPWPMQPDGNGPSLERRYAWAYGNDPANWGASANAGTPGLPNSATPVLPWSAFLPSVQRR